MSQTTRDWLLNKYTKAVQAIHDVEVARQAAQANYQKASIAEAELSTRVAALEREAETYRGSEAVQERLKQMSVSGHVKVYVKDCFGKRYDLNIDSVHTSDGKTTIHGYI